jgi:hypothetical protein
LGGLAAWTEEEKVACEEDRGDLDRGGEGEEDRGDGVAFRREGKSGT